MFENLVFARLSPVIIRALNTLRRGFFLTDSDRPSGCELACDIDCHPVRRAQLEIGGGRVFWLEKGRWAPDGAEGLKSAPCNPDVFYSLSFDVPIQRKR
jgi:hypothetical protein